jgi:hypothetical protein
VQGPREPAPQARPPIPVLGLLEPGGRRTLEPPRRRTAVAREGAGMLGDPVLALAVRLLVLLVVLVLLAAIVRNTRRR